MDFIESYKRLDKLCGDLLQDDRRLSAYIDEMQGIPRGGRYVPSWETDLKHLKHYRWIRNQIAHEPGVSEQDFCTAEDVAWLDEFYQRILQQTDPLALYRKATRPHATPRVSDQHTTPLDDTPRVSDQHTSTPPIAIGCAVLLLGVSLTIFLAACVLLLG